MPTHEEERNLAVVGEYFAEYWGQGNADIVDKLCADEFVINYPMHGPRYGREAAKAMLREFKEARYPNTRETPDMAPEPPPPLAKAAIEGGHNTTTIMATTNLEECDLEVDSSSDLSDWRRYIILFVVSRNCLVVTSSSTSLLIATPEIAATLNGTVTVLNATNSAVLMAMGISSLIWSPLPDILSRRVSYNAAIAALLLSSIGTALSRNVAAFTATRIITGLTGTYFMVAGQTIVADIFEPLLRGRAVGCLMVGGVAGTAIGPCIPGLIVSYDKWQTIYWLQVGQAAFSLASSLLFIPSFDSKIQQLSDKTTTDAKLSPLDIVRLFNPAKVFRLFLQKEVVLADITCGILAMSQYGLLTSVRYVINPRFHLTDTLVSGLFYISTGAGFIAGSLIGGQLSDRTVKRWIAKRDGRRLPRDRLNSSLFHLFAALPVVTIIYAWGLDKNTGGLPLAIIMAFWIGFALMGAWNGLNTYTGEVLPDQRAQVISSKYFMQYCFGAAATGIVVPLIDVASIG